MTKLELKAAEAVEACGACDAAWATARGAATAYVTTRDAAWDATDAFLTAETAYQAELKKSKENK